MKECVICNTQFECSIYLKNLNQQYCSQECINIKYTCPFCSVIILDSGNFKKHIKKCKIKKCIICEIEFHTTSSVKITCGKKCSRVNQNKSQIRMCLHCDYLGSDNYDMKRHIERIHTSITCTCCGKGFTKYETNTKNTSTLCSDECRKIHKKGWSREWLQKQKNDVNSNYNNPIHQLTRRIRNGIRQSFKHKKIRKTNKTFLLLCYTKEELIEHIESQFTNGMSWDRFSEIHIDHIRPVSSFNFDSTDHPDFKKCWALNNLQLLWAKDNISKGNKWDGEVNA